MYGMDAITSLKTGRKGHMRHVAVVVAVSARPTVACQLWRLITTRQRF